MDSKSPKRSLFWGPFLGPFKKGHFTPFRWGSRNSQFEALGVIGYRFGSVGSVSCISCSSLYQDVTELGRGLLAGPILGPFSGGLKRVIFGV